MISVSPDKTTTGTLRTHWVICTNTSALSRKQELMEEAMLSPCKASDTFNRKTSADHKKKMLLSWLYLNYACVLIVIPKEKNVLFF